MAAYGAKTIMSDGVPFTEIYNRYGISIFINTEKTQVIKVGSPPGLTMEEILFQQELANHMDEVPKVLQIESSGKRIMFKQECAPGISFWKCQTDHNDWYKEHADVLHKNLRLILLKMVLSCRASHGDMHTSNVMIDVNGGGGFKIIDFGRSVQIDLNFCIFLYDCFEDLFHELDIFHADVVNVLMNTQFLKKVLLHKRNVIIALSYLYTNKISDANCKEFGCFRLYHEVLWKQGTDVSCIKCGSGKQENVIISIDAQRFEGLCKDLFNEDDYAQCELKQVKLPVRVKPSKPPFIIGGFVLVELTDGLAYAIIISINGENCTIWFNHDMHVVPLLIVYPITIRKHSVDTQALRDSSDQQYTVDKFFIYVWVKDPPNVHVARVKSISDTECIANLSDGNEFNRPFTFPIASLYFGYYVLVKNEDDNTKSFAKVNGIQSNFMYNLTYDNGVVKNVHPRLLEFYGRVNKDGKPCLVQITGINPDGTDNVKYVIDGSDGIVNDALISFIMKPGDLKNMKIQIQSKMMTILDLNGSALLIENDTNGGREYLDTLTLLEYSKTKRGGNRKKTKLKNPKRKKTKRMKIRK